MLSRIAASRRHFTHRSDGNRKQLKAAERASERETREREKRKEARFARWIVIFHRSRSLLSPCPLLLYVGGVITSRSVCGGGVVCVRACVSVAALADCADGVSFVTSLNPAAHYLGLCPCTFLSAVGAVRSITSHGNLLQHADCSCTDRRVCVCV